MTKLTDALRWIGRFIRQEERLEIEESTDTLLVVCHSRSLSRSMTQFNAQTGDLMQRGRRVASFTSIRSVRRSHEQDSDEPPYWTVDLALANGRLLRIGRCGDDASASICAARISAITGKPVQFDPQGRAR